MKNIELLAANGIKATEVTTTKNGVNLTGYQLECSGNIKPVVYFKPNATDEEKIAACEKALQNIPSINIDFDTEKILSRPTITIQKQSNENIVKKNILDLECIPRVIHMVGSDGIGTSKITPDLQEKIGLDTDGIIRRAVDNIKDSFEIIGMGELFAKKFGIQSPIPCGNDPFDVVTNSTGWGAAAALMIPDIFGKYCDDRKIDHCLIIPSSVHELLIVNPDFEDGSNFVGMINDVNDSVVEPVDRLNPTLYRYDRSTNEITIAKQ